MNWVLLPVLNKVTNQMIDNPFRISPQNVTVPANSSYAFNVKFAPYEPDSYFFQIAQCYIQLLNGTQNKVKKLTSGTTGFN